MDTRKIAREVRLRHWTEVIRGCQESGQTIAVYCEANGINEKSYYYWQRKIREKVCEITRADENRRVEETTVSTSTFAEVAYNRHVRARETALVVHIGNATVEIREDADAVLVASVLRTLGEQC